MFTLLFREPCLHRNLSIAFYLNTWRKPSDTNEGGSGALEKIFCEKDFITVE